MSTTADQARTALERVCARGDLVRARELYAEDFVDHVNALEFHGRDGIAKSVALYRAVFPDLQIRVEATATHRFARGGSAAKYLAARLDERTR